MVSRYLALLHLNHQRVAETTILGIGHVRDHYAAIGTGFIVSCPTVGPIRPTSHTRVIGRDIANLPPAGVHFSFQVIMPFAAGPVLRSRCAFTLNNPLCYAYAKYRIDIACSLMIPRSSVHSAWRMYVHCQWDTRYVMAIYVHTLKDTIQDSSDNIF